MSRKLKSNELETPKLIYDVFSLIISVLNTRDALSFSLSSKYYLSLRKTFVSKGKYVGTTRLYDRQIKALDWINSKFKNGVKRLFCCAYMSFGKTLVGFGIAKKYRKTDSIVMILVPGNVIKVWQREYFKHFRVPKSVKDRHVLFWNVSTQRKLIQANPYGKIIVGSPNCKQIKKKNFSDPFLELVKKSELVVVDEAHRNEEVMTVLPVELPDTNFLYLGASFRDNLPKKIEIYRPFGKDIMPSFTVHFKIYNHQKILSKIINSKAKYQVLVLDQEYHGLVHGDYGNTPTHLYMKHNVTAFRKHQDNGGLLVSTIRKIAEGENINKCQIAHIIAGDGISLQRYQQVIGRVVRQSSVFNKVKIYVHIQEEMTSYTVGRLVLIDMPWMGYEVKSSINKLKHIGLLDESKINDEEENNSNEDDSKKVKIDINRLIGIRSKYNWPEKILMFAKKVNCSAEGPSPGVRAENTKLVLEASIL